MTEYDNEPIPGLPGIPPAGERIIWQGAPDWRVLARTAFHTRLVAGYFGVLALWALAWALAGGISSIADLLGFGMTVLGGVLSVALLHVIAWASARSTIYTLTTRRIVMRIGIALPKCINLPLSRIAAANLAPGAAGSGDLSLSVLGKQQLGFLGLWPHARGWKLSQPEPTLRALADAAEVAALVARTCLAAHPETRLAVAEARAPAARAPIAVAA